MANDKPPFVAIIGGIWELDDKKRAQAKAFAAEIGAQLAKAEMGLVVYYSNEESLEPHVVSGYVPALPQEKGTHMIHIRYAQHSQTGKVTFPAQAKHGHVFNHDPFPGDDWEAPFYRSLAQADGVDAVLLLAGARSTLIAGEISVARPLPILAIEKFGGSAAIIQRELATLDKKYPNCDTQNAAQLVRWLKEKCADRAKKQAELRKFEKEYAKQVSQHEKTIWALGTFILLMLILYYGVGKSPDPGNYIFLMLVSMTVAGSTGALIRSLISGADGTPPFRSLSLGAFAGFIVGAAYILPLLMKGPIEVVIEKTPEIPLSSKVQLICAILVGVSGGMGFDTVFTKIRRQGEGLPVNTPGRTH
jgi:hypothetical protein